MATRATAGTTASAGTISKGQIWTGRVMSTLAVLFLLFDSAMKFAKIAQVLEAFDRLEWPRSTIIPVATLLLLCTIVYIIPRTAILGAILLTGYLGGAVATHFRHQDPLFSHILFPVYLGILVWGGLYAQDLSLRALIPLRDEPRRTSGSV